MISMPQFLAPLLLVSSGSLPPDVPTPAADALKCAARSGAPAEMTDWVVIVNEEVLEGEMSEWDPSAYGKIELAEVVCWDWVEAHHGVQVGRGAYYCRHQ